MQKLFCCGLALMLVLAVYLTVNQRAEIQAAEDDAGPMIAHMVYFSLNDTTPAEKKKLIAACKKYLSDHPGTVYFSAGMRATEFSRDVNDQDFDVALHLVFKNKAAHDKYQEDAKHKQFIQENMAGWRKVRVFDTKVEK